ncbi:MAG: hypothetical protein EXQ94_12435 [Alphaproteobacteria bacterium]|nr:hypothetical protein [Alphaproteobacteria bacterium]
MTGELHARWLASDATLKTVLPAVLAELERRATSGDPEAAAYLGEPAGRVERVKRRVYRYRPPRD